MLPDEVLLEIFDFYADEEQFTKKQIEAWQTLVHVCRLWRNVVFRSPHRLNLRLVCTPRTPVRHTVDVWPALPVLIRGEGSDTSDMNNIISVLERDVRVSQIKLVGVPGLQLGSVSTAMKASFLELTHLELWSFDDAVPVLPDSFLGGSTPSLRFLLLSRIPFPGIPTLLLSATQLVDLHLWEIPHFCYISPEAMLTTLFTLTSLESLSLKFQPCQLPHTHLDQESRPPCFVLPVLTRFWFKGEYEYLDDLVASIDSPQLEYLDITFFNDVEFQTPQLVQFVTRAPTLNAPEKAVISFENGAARVKLSSQTSGYGEVIVEILCIQPEWQISSLAEVCTSSFPPLSTLEDLCIFDHPCSQLYFRDDINDKLWQDLFISFDQVKNLYLSEVSVSYIEVVLRRGNTAEVFPALQNIFLEGLQPSGTVPKAFEEFVNKRETVGRPIVASPWVRKSRFLGVEDY